LRLIERLGARADRPVPLRCAVPLVFRAPFALVGLVLLCVALSCSSLGKVARHPHVLLNTQQFRT